jgi:pimeloyl-ACP methyl ester carboxylesterase
MPTYERGKVRIHYEEMGSGFPLLVIPGGGLNSTIAGLDTSHPFNAMKEFAKDGFRCIGADLRNANAGQSSGPLEIDRPWDAFTDDHVGLMDHLGIDKFMVLGYCIGGPFIWNLIKRAQARGRRPADPAQQLPPPSCPTSSTRTTPSAVRRSSVLAAHRRRDDTIGSTPYRGP